MLDIFRKIDDFRWVNFRDLYLGAGDEFRWVSARLRTSTERNLNDKDKFEMLKIAANTFFRHIFIRLSNENGIFKTTDIFQCSMGCTYFDEINDFRWVNFSDLYLSAGDEFRWVSAPLRTSTERNLNDKDKFEMLKIAANTFFRHIFIRLSNENGIFKSTYIFQCSMGCTYFDEIADSR